MGSIVGDGFENVSGGAARSVVERYLGVPDHKSNDDFWVYRHFGAASEAAADLDCTGLVVDFAEDGVKAMLLVKERAFAPPNPSVRSGASGI